MEFNVTNVFQKTFDLGMRNNVSLITKSFSRLIKVIR
jgi:hypothetical protein